MSVNPASAKRDTLATTDQFKAIPRHSNPKQTMTQRKRPVSNKRYSLQTTRLRVCLQWGHPYIVTVFFLLIPTYVL